MDNKYLNKLKNLPIPGKVSEILKRSLFISAAAFIGLWIGIKAFFPDDFVLSKVNEQLFIRDMAIAADDVSVSMLGSISFSDGSLKKKGEEVATFGELAFSPKLFSVLGGKIAGTLSLENINSQGGELEATFSSGEEPCYSFVSDEVPLSLVNLFMNDISLTGAATGEGKVCAADSKYNGTVSMKSEDVVFRGKIPTAMGDFDVGKIILGKLDILADIEENKIEIKRFIVDGMFELDAAGKITLNTRMMTSSRLDLDVRINVKDMAKISENTALNLLISQLSQYKGEKENSYAFLLRGFVSKPQMSKAPKERAVKGDNERQQPKKNEKPEKPAKAPKPAKKPEKKPERLPKTQPQPGRPMPQSEPAAQPQVQPQEDQQKADELKRKEDELKRKEEELKKKEEADREREEKMKEEREQREREERERREQEERERAEEAEKIKMEREDAMREVQRAREEAEAARARAAEEESEEKSERIPAGEEKIDANEDEEE